MKLLTRKKQQGLSLIEMLFVLIIVVVLIFMGVFFMQRHIAREKIQNAAMNMKQWLSASLAYYEQKSSWPTSPADLKSAGYMPENASVNNPWGGRSNKDSKYQYHLQVPASCPNRVCFSIYTNTFTVAQAQQLAGLLPDATVSGTKITSTMVVPNFHHGKGFGVPTMVKPGAIIHQPHCSGVLTPQIYVSTSSFDAGSGQPIEGVYTTAQVVMDRQGQEAWRVEMAVTTASGIIRNPPNAVLTVFSYCGINTNKKQQKQATENRFVG